MLLKEDTNQVICIQPDPIDAVLLYKLSAQAQWEGAGESIETGPLYHGMTAPSHAERDADLAIELDAREQALAREGAFFYPSLREQFDGLRMLRVAKSLRDMHGENAKGTASTKLVIWVASVCNSSELPLPQWAGSELARINNDISSLRFKNWEDFLGPLNAKNAKIENIRRNREIQLKILGDVRLLRFKEKIGATEALRRLEAKYASCKTTVQDHYYALLKEMEISKADIS